MGGERPPFEVEGAAKLPPTIPGPRLWYFLSPQAYTENWRWHLMYEWDTIEDGLSASIEQARGAVAYAASKRAGELLKDFRSPPANRVEREGLE